MNKQLPNLRTNIATWAVPVDQVPAVTEAMLETLPPGFCLRFAPVLDFRC
jgi:hypothetical protein